MRKVYVDQLKEGMRLARTIHNDRGDILLARGVELTRQYIGALRKLGYYAVYILDGLADDVEPPEEISEQVRIATYKHVRQLYTVVQSCAAQFSGESLSFAAERLSDEAAPLMAHLYRDVERIVDEILTAETLSGVAPLKTHDNYTFEHSVEVTVAGVMLGKRLYLPQREIHQLALGCLCHDIGKTVVPSEILRKLGRLTEEEFAIVKQHPSAGYDAVRQFMGTDDIIARHIVWQHHERQDGTGYPCGLKGNNRFGPTEPRLGKRLILPAAEIAAVADVYSALASDRPYRRALNPPEIVAVLRKTAGTHLNQELVRRFLTILPTYPIGTEVVLISGELRGHRGVVVDTPSNDINRPTIRILFDQYGRRVTPFEVNTAAEREIQLAMPSYAAEALQPI